MKVPYSKVQCTGNELAYVREVLESGWLTTASKTRELEMRFAERLGVKHALAVNSCTSALHLALEAVGVTSGDKVFVPSLTFTASAEVIRYLGAHPILVDVNIETNSIDAEILTDAIAKHPDVKTVIGVHFGGLALPMSGSDGLLDICKANGIDFIEDAAHALPSCFDGNLVGSIGDVSCFSFYANKTMTTGEGGMLVTNRDDIAERVKIMRLHGIDRDVWDRFTSNNASWEYDVIAPGYKYNLPDLNAAVGLAQFEKLEEMHATRVACAERYRENLIYFNQVTLPFYSPNIEDHAWHLFPIRLARKYRHSRNEIIQLLNAVGVGTSVHYKPLHRLKYYRDQYKLKTLDYPNSEEIWLSTISLPIFSSMLLEEVDYVCEALKSILVDD